jgi:hypothetical protein
MHDCAHPDLHPGRNWRFSQALHVDTERRWKGDKRVKELTTINQYFAYARQEKKESIDERKHADRLIDPPLKEAIAHRERCVDFVSRELLEDIVE